MNNGRLVDPELELVLRKACERQGLSENAFKLAIGELEDLFLTLEGASAYLASVLVRGTERLYDYSSPQENLRFVENVPVMWASGFNNLLRTLKEIIVKTDTLAKTAYALPRGKAEMLKSEAERVKQELMRVPQIQYWVKHQLIPLLKRTIAAYAQGLQRPCPKISGEPIQRLRKEVLSVLGKRLYEDLFKLGTAGKPESIFSTKGLKLILVLSTLAGLLCDKELAYLANKFYFFFICQLFFFKKIPRCNPDAINMAFSVLSGKNDLKKLQLRYDKLAEYKASRYWEKILPFISKCDIAGYLHTVTVTWDYGRTVCKSSLASLARFYYDVQKGKIKKIKDAGKVAADSEASIPVTVFPTIRAKFIHELRLFLYQTRSPLFTCFVQHLLKDQEAINELVKLFIGKWNKHVEHPVCSPAWLTQVSRVNKRKDMIKALEKIDEYSTRYLLACAKETEDPKMKRVFEKEAENVIRYSTYRKKYRDIVLKALAAAVRNTMCSSQTHMSTLPITFDFPDIPES